MHSKLYNLMFLAVLLPGIILADGTIEGTVTDATSGEALVGANVLLVKTDYGAATNEAGEFVIPDVPDGSYTLRVTHIGYKEYNETIRINNSALKIDIELQPTEIRGERVIVEPTRAIERKTPVTFSSLSKEELQYRDPIEDIPVMLSDLPSIKTYSETGTGMGYTYLNIRGFDQRRISVLINGIPQNDPEDHNVYWLNFFDLVGSLDDIQVQRGAGTAFYGPAAIGGSVNLITENYSWEPDFKVETQFGSYNTRKLSAEGSTGLLNDHWVGYGRLTRITTDNYRDWAWMDFTRYFAGLAYFSDNHIVKLQTYGGPQNDGLAFYGVPKEDLDDRNARRSNYSEFTEDEEWFNQPHYELIHQWNLTENLKISNTLYFIRGYGYFDYDGSWAPPSYYRLSPSNFAPNSWADSLGTVSMAGNTMIRAYVDNKQGGLLHRYIWNHGKGELTAGLAVRAHGSLHWGRIQETEGIVFNDTLNSETNVVSLGDENVGAGGRHYYEYNGAKSIYSVFLHENYNLTPSVNLLFDVQFTSKEYRFYNEKFLNHEFDVPYLFVNPSVGVNMNFTDRLNGYLNVAKTTREPRLKNYYDAAEASQPASWGLIRPNFERRNDGSFNYDEPLVHPETLFDYEAGAGYRTSRTTLNLNFYLMDFRNEIVSNGQLDRFGQPITGNADRTRHYGAEFSGAYKILPSLRVSGNYTVSRNVFIEHTSFGWSESDTLDGNTIAGFPGQMGNLEFQYNKDRWFARLHGQFVGKQYTTNFEEEEFVVDPYNVWDARFGYRFPVSGGSLNLTLTVNNIFDVLYATHGEGGDFFPGATRNYFLSMKYDF
ncbi:MAG: TonB-dependent receptor [Candidatus Marinimicrobia bacterium]|nr:TonB-dependent receptor [Candidatus Neomarinimicrobiota bacterium]MCF7829684.1 TonB-dependent receptor [Candidatus Neomarinimicrobiota bacterium]MCF7879844.1 TonB-dependent receptor [Candidatus Neomarinimicrobiota bacterium]